MNALSIVGTSGFFKKKSRQKHRCFFDSNHITKKLISRHFSSFWIKLKTWSPTCNACSKILPLLCEKSWRARSPPALLFIEIYMISITCFSVLSLLLFFFFYICEKGHLQLESPIAMQVAGSSELYKSANVAVYFIYNVCRNKTVQKHGSEICCLLLDFVHFMSDVCSTELVVPVVFMYDQTST